MTLHHAGGGNTDRVLPRMAGWLVTHERIFRPQGPGSHPRTGHRNASAARSPSRSSSRAAGRAIADSRTNVGQAAMLFRTELCLAVGLLAVSSAAEAASRPLTLGRQTSRLRLALAVRPGGSARRHLESSRSGPLRCHRLRPLARCTPAQPQDRRASHSQETSGRVHRGERIRQVVAGLRHPLRRRSTALRRVALELRPTVLGPTGKAPVRSHPGSESDHRHRAEVRRFESSVHRGHHHGDSRLSANHVRAHRSGVTAPSAERKCSRSPPTRSCPACARRIPRCCFSHRSPRTARARSDGSWSGSARGDSCASGTRAW